MEGFFRFGSPVIELMIQGRRIGVVLDTGFNGHLMLPEAIIKELDLEQIGISDFVTASGHKNITKVYVAKLEFFDEEIEVPVLSTDANFSLAGMELFHSCTIVIERSKEIVQVTKP